MKMTFTTIHVTDLERSITFYKEIMGLKEQRRFPAGPNMEIAFLADGPTEVELICDTAVTEVRFTEHLSLGFAVDSLDEAMELMEKNHVKIIAGPFSPNPQTRFFFVNDPDGVTLQIIEQK